MAELYPSSQIIKQYLDRPPGHRAVKWVEREILIQETMDGAIDELMAKCDISWGRADDIIRYVYDENLGNILFNEEHWEMFISDMIECKKQEELKSRPSLNTSTEAAKSTISATKQPIASSTISIKSMEATSKPKVSSTTTLTLNPTSETILCASSESIIKIIECEVNILKKQLFESMENYNKLKFKNNILQKEWNKFNHLNEVKFKKMQESIIKLQMELQNNNNNIFTVNNNAMVTLFDGEIIDENKPSDLSMDILFHTKLQSVELEINSMNNQLTTDKNKYDEIKQQYEEQKILIIKIENECKLILTLEESSKFVESVETALSSNGKMCGADSGGGEYGDFRNNKSILNASFCGADPGGGDYRDIRNKNKLCKASLNGELIGADIGDGDHGGNKNKENVLNISSNDPGGGDHGGFKNKENILKILSYHKSCGADPRDSDYGDFKNENKLFIASSNGECIGADPRGCYYADIDALGPALDPTPNPKIESVTDPPIAGVILNNNNNIKFVADPGGGDYGAGKGAVKVLLTSTLGPTLDPTPDPKIESVTDPPFAEVFKLKNQQKIGKLSLTFGAVIGTSSKYVSNSLCSMTTLLAPGLLSACYMMNVLKTCRGENSGAKGDYGGIDPGGGDCGGKDADKISMTMTHDPTIDTSLDPTPDPTIEPITDPPGSELLKIDYKKKMLKIPITSGCGIGISSKYAINSLCSITTLSAPGLSVLFRMNRSTTCRGVNSPLLGEEIQSITDPPFGQIFRDKNQRHIGFLWKIENVIYYLLLPIIKNFDFVYDFVLF